MPLIRFEGGQWVEDMVAGEPPLRMLADFLAQPTAGRAVQLEPADDPAHLQEHLAGLDLIAIAFPRYTDGRGFSQAQLLRRRFGYRGALRANGHVLRDQVAMMARCGFDSFETSRAGLSDIEAALAEYGLAYQAAADRLRPIPLRRHEDRSDTRSG